jgi:hypothetical protein
MLKRRSKPRPTMDLRRQTQRETVARLLLLGWTAERVARKMGVSARQVRYHIATPEFEALYTKLQQEYLQRVDRQLGALLTGACDALERMLKHSDWRAREAAIHHILKVHGRYIERVDVSGSFDQVRHVQGELVEGQMNDEMRQKRENCSPSSVGCSSAACRQSFTPALRTILFIESTTTSQAASPAAMATTERAEHETAEQSPHHDR